MKTFKITSAVATSFLLALALSSCASPEPAPAASSDSSSATETTVEPTPSPTSHEPQEISFEGAEVEWDDIAAILDRDIPVLWLKPELGATLTLVGSNVVERFEVSGMNTERNAAGDLVVSPETSAFDETEIISSGGEICTGLYFNCIRVHADKG